MTTSPWVAYPSIPQDGPCDTCGRDIHVVGDTVYVSTNSYAPSCTLCSECRKDGTPRIYDLPQGWTYIPDPSIAGEQIALNTDKDGVPLALAINEEGRPEVSVLTGFTLCPCGHCEGFDGSVVFTGTLDAAIEHANGLMELGDQS